MQPSNDHLQRISVKESKILKDKFLNTCLTNSLNIFINKKELKTKNINYNLQLTHISLKEPVISQKQLDFVC